MAVDHVKPILVFRKDTASVDTEAEQLVSALGLKYDRFSTADELEQRVRASLGCHLLGLIRGDTQSPSSPGDMLAKLRVGKRRRTLFAIQPTIPMSKNSFFTVEDVAKGFVTFQLGGFANVSVPIERIADVLEAGSASKPTVCLNGRLQYVTKMQKLGV